MQIIYFLKAYHAGNQYRPVLTQYYRVPTSTALYWPSIQWFDGLDHVNQIFSESISHWQPVPPCSNPVLPNTNQYRSILTQYHQLTTNTGGKELSANGEGYPFVRKNLSNSIQPLPLLLHDVWIEHP